MTTVLLGLVLSMGGVAQAAAPTCPQGMVLIGGQGQIGMKGQPYGVVHTAHLEKVVAPQLDCEQAVASTPGATACWVQTDLVDPVIPVHAVTVAPFCIDTFPFPGKGGQYAVDGMSVWDAHQLDTLLQTGRYGDRRMCTATEFQAAVAGLNSNQRFVFGDTFIDKICDGAAIGAAKACVNAETSVAEYGAVHSHWTIADPSFVASACPEPPCLGAGNRPLGVGMYIVSGGTGRVQTRQAPFTPHTWHDHGEATVGACGFSGWDDQPVICSDPTIPTPEQNKAWAEFLGLIQASGKMRASLSAALGRKICP